MFRLTPEPGVGLFPPDEREAIVAVLAEQLMPAEHIGSLSPIKILFGPFELNVAERSLRKADDVIPLGGRAFDILLALLDRPGEVVSKGDLIARVWPDVTVEEGSLRVHLSALRKALGERQFRNKYITNVQGRGYCFAAPVVHRVGEPDKGSAFSKSSNLPPALNRMIGRDDAVLGIRARFRTERLIAVLGAGGIGKTTVALAVGHGALADFSGAVFFVDLSAVKDRAQVVGAIASAIGIDLQVSDPEGALFSYLRSRKALMVLDSCEHLIDETAEVIDCILQCAPDIYMLATSREALQTADERAFRLHPLDCPPETADTDSSAGDLSCCRAIVRGTRQRAGQRILAEGRRGFHCRGNLSPARRYPACDRACGWKSRHFRAEGHRGTTGLAARSPEIWPTNCNPPTPNAQSHARLEP
jgi:DNA-binding winged helix-turn-helix (wHTH) protein